MLFGLARHEEAEDLFRKTFALRARQLGEESRPAILSAISLGEVRAGSCEGRLRCAGFH